MATRRHLSAAGEGKKCRGDWAGTETRWSDHLVDHIEEDAPWDQILSGGEKQRLAFARILLHRPNIVVLDEAELALDPASQDRMMELLAKELRATTIVSVAHRPELEAFHDRKITLEPQREGARFVADVHLVPSHHGVT